LKALINKIEKQNQQKTCYLLHTPLFTICTPIAEKRSTGLCSLLPAHPAVVNIGWPIAASQNTTHIVAGHLPFLSTLFLLSCVYTCHCHQSKAL
jgi:hypothetical protein